MVNKNIISFNNRTKSLLSANKDWIVYIAIFLIALLWNLTTLEYSIPWCDEVMLADQPANMHFWGKWCTTAYNFNGEGNTLFCTYLPLYTWTIYAWISLFGFSFLKVRLFGVFVSFLLGIVLIKILKSVTKSHLKIAETLVFSILFWFSDIIFFTYRMARPEMLGALFVALFFLYTIKYLKTGKSFFWQQTIFCSFAILCGVQSALCIGISLVFCGLFFRPIKRVAKSLVYMLCGFGIGTAIALLYFYIFGEMKNFIVEVMNHSSILMKTWDTVKHIIYPLIGKVATPTALPIDNGGVAFSEKVTEMFGYSGISVVLGIVVIITICNYPIKAIMRKLPTKLVLLSLFIDLCFNLAGRFPTYYMWTAALPLILAAAIIIADCKKNLFKIIAIIASLLTVGPALKFNLNEETVVKRIDGFINKQGFKESDKIAAPFCTFYSLKPSYPNTFFYQICPEKIMGKVNYVILQKADDKYSDFNMSGMQSYIDKLQHNKNCRIEKFSSMSNPTLIVYKIFWNN